MRTDFTVLWLLLSDIASMSLRFHAGDKVQINLFITSNRADTVIYSYIDQDLKDSDKNLKNFYFFLFKIFFFTI